jgi:hypothetical protein
MTRGVLTVVLIDGRRSVPDEYCDQLLAEGLMSATERADIGQWHRPL